MSCGVDGAADLPASLIPAPALPHWHALRAAVNERGPVPCEGAVLPIETWYSNRAEDIELACLACQICPARAECAAYALAAGERHGVWAGLRPEERRR